MEDKRVVHIVDDEDAIRRSASFMLKTSGFDVLSYPSGVAFLKAIGRDAPGCVLLDVRMPEMDGNAALTELRKLPGTELLPVIAVTASSMMDDEQVLRGYFAGYVRKPFTRRELFNELAAFLPRRVLRSLTRAGEPAESAPAEPSSLAQANLTLALRQLESGLWREASESGAINDVKVFAARLAQLGQASGSAAVQTYAAALQHEADVYAILRMETRLKDFPNLIQSLEVPAIDSTAESVPPFGGRS